MKNLILILFFTFISNKISSQISIQVSHDPGRGIGIVSPVVSGLNKSINVASDIESLTTFDLSTKSAIPLGHKLIITCTDVALDTSITPNGDYSNATNSKKFTFKSDIIDHLIEVKYDNGSGIPKTIVTFKFKKDSPQKIDPENGGAPVIGAANNSIPSLTDVLVNIEGKYQKTKIGFVENELATSEDLDKENPVHIFFDQNGNNLLGTIPQGISNRQYIVHIIFPGYTDVEDNIIYSVRQKSGTYNNSLNFLNNGIQNQVTSNLQASIETRDFDIWKEKTFLLGTATDDLTFEIIATTFDSVTKRSVTGVLQTYVIKMSPVYHGSFDIGLINSELKNPTYTLTASPTNSSEMLVKETDGGNRGIVTLMATFYTSPIILFEKLLEKRTKKHIPSYKLTGRNFLDDHKFYERIYPAIGVSLSDKTFENLFFGLNWEIARGLSLFGGGHWGKINTFDMPGYQKGTTVVTQQQFDYYTNRKWDSAWAYGVKLDILVIANLFK
jgi:hypothetical protein